MQTMQEEVCALGVLSPHDHACLIYDSAQDQFTSILPYIQLGLQRGERCLYIADDNPVDAVVQAMRDHGIDVKAALRSGQLQFIDATEAYLRDGVFVIEDMCRLLEEIIGQAAFGGFRALRIAAEMTWAIRPGVDSERLLPYESGLNRFYPRHQAVGVCQYSRKKFPPEMLLDVIHTHPIVIRDGVVYRNMYYLPPEEYLDHSQVDQRVLRMLREMRERQEAHDKIRGYNHELETRIRERTRELEQLNQDLRSANEAKDRFIAALSHELRTPLTPVLMLVSALEMEEGLAPETREHLRMVRTNVEMEARLIDDLLDLSRLVRGKLTLNPRTFNVHAKIRNTIDICSSELKAKQLVLRVALDAPGHHVLGDAGRLQQVFWNVVKNAVKFTPAGGGIEIRTSNPRPDILRVTVTDTGIGIDPELLPAIFDAFAQANPRITRHFGGLGLGLAISKAVLELHGATIQASSKGRGKGATFTVELFTVGAGEVSGTREVS